MAALFVVLDPFWYSNRRGGDDGWAWTLGQEQYQWLARTLAQSDARFTFVFIHHLVGGDQQARGGAEASRSFEWGGANADGTPGFAFRRRGWELPVHNLLVKHRVTAVFHGHDHFYAHQERDGVAYQEVPQPGDARGGSARAAGEYGYTAGTMFNADLYAVNMRNAASRQPDFYVALGDDFSIEKLIDQNNLTQENVDQVYRYQRTYFGLLGGGSSLFLVNGNHEQAAGYLLGDRYNTPYRDAPIFAGRARVTYFPLPAPDGFYSGDTMQVPGVGLVRDYYAFEWGDALFVVIDPYWHSPVPVDNGVPGVEKTKDAWEATIGHVQMPCSSSLMNAAGL